VRLHGGVHDGRDPGGRQPVVTRLRPEDRAQPLIAHVVLDERLRRQQAPARDVRGPEGQARHVWVAGLAGEGRHAVMTVSMPAGRYEALAPSIAASLDSFRQDPGPVGPLSRSTAGAIAGALAGALMVSLALWRRRPRTRLGAEGDEGQEAP